MTPAEELRAAADKLRRLAAQADDGPWVTTWRGQEYHLEGCRDDGLPPISISEWTYAVATQEPKASEQRAECDTANADYIAAMHPGVGLPLATVFDAWARMGELDPDLLNRVGGPETLAVARAINGGQQ